MTSIPLKYRLRALAGGPLRRRMRSAQARFLQAASLQCRETQQLVLQRLLKLNQDSIFSRDRRLTAGMSLPQFRSSIPVSDYELVRPYIQRVAAGERSALLGEANRLLMFAVTSGTTAESKLIPVTEQFLSDYRSGWQMWGIGAYSKHAVLQKLNIVQISSSHNKFSTAAQIPCGNISGLVAAMQNPIVKTLYTVPSAVAEIADADTKRYAIMRLALADPHVGMLITANPSTLLQLIDSAGQHQEQLIRDIHDGGFSGGKLPDGVGNMLKSAFKKSPARARTLEHIATEHGCLRPRLVWPMLGLLGVWCGGSAAAYIPRLKQHFDNIPIRDHGLHASEGRMTLPLEDNSPAGVLEVQTHFFEFIPVREAESSSPVVLEAHELAEGEEYLILMTTSSGLYRYNIRDVVRCVGFFGTTPILEFRHKGAHISSITGEKLAESQVVDAVRAASLRTNFDPRLFTLTPVWGEPPGYTLFVAADVHEASVFAGDGSSRSLATPVKLLEFASAVDNDLRSRNVEYGEKRHTGRLQKLTVMPLPKDAWQTFLRNRQQCAGGSAEQYKHPCLVPDPLFENLFLKTCGLQ
jgi:hypothetical protein